MDDAPPLHPDLGPIAFLLGEWHGSGAGEYPTIDPFRYDEHLRFTHVGKPFLAYSQATWHPDTRAPMHVETGYWRCFPGEDGAPAHVEVVVAHPVGIGEVLVGTVLDRSVELATLAVTCTPTAKEVTALERQVVVVGDVLRYRLSMAAVGQPLTHHLSAELVRG